MFHGGAEYAKFMLKEAIRRSCFFDVVFDETLYTDPDIEILLQEMGCRYKVFYVVSKMHLYGIYPFSDENVQPNLGSPSKKAYYRDPYMFGFIQGLFFRTSCYKCPYAYADRVGDFTLSDFWGLGKDARMELGKGVSAVFINTEKARDLFEAMKEEVAYEPREVQEAIVGNGQLQRLSFRHPQYDLYRISSIWFSESGG